jgi:CHAT domain-containing protein
VEGFAALAQQKGAGAVLTTLWPVNDAFTSGLMRQFYSLGKAKSTPGNVTGKAEALREAQVALLSGFLQGVPGYAPQRQPR